MIQVSFFDNTKDGKEVSKIEFSNRDLYCSILTYGATVNRLVFCGDDVVLGYDHLKDYENQNGSYQGALIGRFGNRIADGKFSLNGKEYTLACNEGNKVHLHGGNEGFDKKIWSIESLSDGEEPSVILSYFSADAEEGYPGNLSVSVTYKITKQNGLEISYQACTDADTVINLTNHSYFSLSKNSCEDVSLWLDAERYLAIDDKLLPTQEVLLSDDEIFNFQMMKKIGKHIHAEHSQLVTAGGYDHCYIFSGSGFRKVAIAIGDKNIQMSVFTDRPAVQFYTGNFLKEKTGRNGVPLTKRMGFCLETQGYPDSPNRVDFPSCVLHPKDTYMTRTEYRFTKA